MVGVAITEPTQEEETKFLVLCKRCHCVNKHHDKSPRVCVFPQVFSPVGSGYPDNIVSQDIAANAFVLSSIKNIDNTCNGGKSMSINTYKISMYRKKDGSDVFKFDNSVMTVPCLAHTDKRDLLRYFHAHVNKNPNLS